MSSAKKYTAAEKVAYYKAKSEGKAKPKNAYAKKKKVAKKSRSRPFTKYGAALGTAVGSAWGPVGTAVGAGIGSIAGRAVDLITGHGAYTINKNTIYANSVPQFASRMTDGCIRMRHKEYIQDVVSSANVGNFKNEQFPISASSQITFPYLSQIAVNFEEFMFEGLVFSYVPSSGSISTTGALGTVIMATQYNSLSVPFSNKQQAEASTYSISQVASMGCLHPIECDMKQTPSQGIFYNVRPNAAQVEDNRWTQLGSFNLMTQGMPAASENVGELWVSYDCVLSKPILIQGDSSFADHWNSIGTGVTAGAPFGVGAVLTSESDGFTTLINPATIAIDASFNGNIAVTYAIHETSADTALVDPLISASVGATQLKLLDKATTHQYLKNASGATGLQEIFTTAYFSIASVGVPSLLVLSGMGATGTVDSLDIIINSIPANFT